MKLRLDGIAVAKRRALWRAERFVWCCLVPWMHSRGVCSASFLRALALVITLAIGGCSLRHQAAATAAPATHPELL